MYRHNQAGFTLVELLVVISIIGLLSSVVLSALNSARAKADDTARVRMVQEYKKAFDLSYDADGYYPGLGKSISDISFGCLGDYVNDKCHDGSSSSNDEDEIPTVIRTALERFIHSRPTMKSINITKYGQDYRFDNPIYLCLDRVGTPTFCIRSKIRWVMRGPNPDCGFGITTVDSSIGLKTGTPPFTTCALYFQN